MLGQLFIKAMITSDKVLACCYFLKKSFFSFFLFTSERQQQQKMKIVLTDVLFFLARYWVAADFSVLDGSKIPGQIFKKEKKKKRSKMKILFLLFVCFFLDEMNQTQANNNFFLISYFYLKPNFPHHLLLSETTFFSLLIFFYLKRKSLQWHWQSIILSQEAANLKTNEQIRHGHFRPWSMHHFLTAYFHLRLKSLQWHWQSIILSQQAASLKTNEQIRRGHFRPWSMHHCKEPAWKEPLTFSQWGPSRPAPHPDHVCCPEPGWGCPAAAACLGGCAAHCGRLPVCHGLLHPPCTCNGTRQVRNPQQKGRKHASFPRSTEITFTSTLTPSLP